MKRLLIRIACGLLFVLASAISVFSLPFWLVFKILQGVIREFGVLSGVQFFVSERDRFAPLNKSISYNESKQQASRRADLSPINV